MSNQIDCSDDFNDLTIGEDLSVVKAKAKIKPSINEVNFLHGKNVKQTKDFSYINWERLVELCSEPMPSNHKTGNTAKYYSHIIAAHDGPNKLKPDTIEHDNFTMLRLDLDDVDYEIKDIESKLLALSFESFIIHTTAKHCQGKYKNRFRVYIQLESGINFHDWALLQTHLADRFKADNCATRPQQIMYLPTNFEGIKFYKIIRQGLAYKVSSTNELYQDALDTREALKVDMEQIQKKYINKKVTKTKKDTANKISIIDAVNNAFSWDMILGESGFKKIGNKWLSPTQTSGSPGGVILTSNTDGKERFYTHSETDQSKYGNGAIDKFDFLLIEHYANNQKNALKDLAKLYFPEIDKFNKTAYAIGKANKQVVKELGELI